MDYLCYSSSAWFRYENKAYSESFYHRSQYTRHTFFIARPQMVEKL